MATFENNRFDPNSTADSNPDRYTGENGLQCWDIIKNELGEDDFASFCAGQCFRYLFRYKKKNGVNDLHKCQDYATQLRELPYPESKLRRISDMHETLVAFSDETSVHQFERQPQKLDAETGHLLDSVYCLIRYLSTGIDMHLDMFIEHLARLTEIVEKKCR